MASENGGDCQRVGGDCRRGAVCDCWGAVLRMAATVYGRIVALKQDGNFKHTTNSASFSLFMNVWVWPSKISMVPVKM